MYIYFSSMNDHLIDSLRMFAPVTILITPNLRMVHLQLSVWVTLPPVGGLTSDEQTFTSSTRKHRRQLQRSCCPHIPYPATLVRLKDKKTLYKLSIINFRCFKNSDYIDTCGCRTQCLCSIHINVDQLVQIQILHLPDQ